MSTPELILYTAQAPNGPKISIALEELGVPYTVRPIAIYRLEQKEPWFLQINPNGRIPALADNAAPLEPINSRSGSKETINLMESGAIMLYLAENYDKEHKLSFPRNTREYWEMVQWLFWQTGGIGPSQGQSVHFLHYASSHIPYGISRYVNETRRLYHVLETRLAEQESKGRHYLVGDKFSMADIMQYPWVAYAVFSGIDMKEFPKLKAWEDRIMQRPLVKKGHDIPLPFTLREVVKDKEMIKKVEEAGRELVQGQMKMLREGDLR